MSIIREIPPTAGWPVYVKDIFASLAKPQKYTSSFEESFNGYLGVAHFKIINSGTSALYLILETLKTLSTRKSVVIPSFICPLVPLAVYRAGLSAEVCDISSDRFDFDYIQLEKTCAGNSDILAIVAAHIAGLPLEIDRIKAIAKKYNIFIIEDCAQSMGAVYQDYQTGSFGDFSFFSLCRGKGLTIYEGGIAVAKNQDHSAALDETFERLIRDNKFSEALKILEIFGYWAFYRPLGFWYIFRLPSVYWQFRGRPLKALIEEFTPDFEVHKISGFRKRLISQQFERLEGNIKKQRAKAQFYIDKISRIKGVRLITELPDSSSNYPFLTCLIEDMAKRDNILTELERSGLGFSRIYAKAICDYDYLSGIIAPDKNCLNARQVARRHITISTSIFLDDRDLVNIVERLKRGLAFKQ